MMAEKAKLDFQILRDFFKAGSGKKHMSCSGSSFFLAINRTPTVLCFLISSFAECVFKMNANPSVLAMQSSLPFVTS